MSDHLPEHPVVYKLWEGQEKPHSRESNVQEHVEVWETIRCVRSITEPTLTVYPSEGGNTGRAVVVIPGGGYEMVCIDHEGYDIAQALAEHGITAAILKYRLPNPEMSDAPHLVPITDARRALRLLRTMAGQYGFRTDKVGVMGFSAGSHLSTVAGLWPSEAEDEIPNFAALIYGVTNITGAMLTWLEEYLYFRKLTEAELAQNRLLDLVSEHTPPAFLAHAYDDETCHVTESILYAERLRANNVPVEMHLFAKGGHGFGLGRREDGTDQWLPLFVNWLKRET